MSSFDDNFKKAMAAASQSKMTEGKKKALLLKPINFRGRLMTKGEMIEEMVRQGGVLKADHFPKYVFSRTAFNRMDGYEQQAYEEKLKTKMPFAVELPDGSFFEITKTESEHFLAAGGQSA